MHEVFLKQVIDNIENLFPDQLKNMKVLEFSHEKIPLMTCFKNQKSRLERLISETVVL